MDFLISCAINSILLPIFLDKICQKSPRKLPSAKVISIFEAKCRLAANPITCGRNKFVGKSEKVNLKKVKTFLSFQKRFREMFLVISRVPPKVLDNHRLLPALIAPVKATN